MPTGQPSNEAILTLLFLQCFLAMSAHFWVHRVFQYFVKEKSDHCLLSYFNFRKACCLSSRYLLRIGSWFKLFIIPKYFFVVVILFFILLFLAPYLQKVFLRHPLEYLIIIAVNDSHSGLNHFVIFIPKNEWMTMSCLLNCRFISTISFRRLLWSVLCFPFSCSVSLTLLLKKLRHLFFFSTFFKKSLSWHPSLQEVLHLWKTAQFPNKLLLSRNVRPSATLKKEMILSSICQQQQLTHYFRFIRFR